MSGAPVVPVGLPENESSCGPLGGGSAAQEAEERHAWSVSTGTRLRDEFAAGAARRDEGREFATSCIESLKESGLLGLCVPREYGGRNGGFSDLMTAVSLVAEGDPNVAQMLQVHNGAIWLLKEVLLKQEANSGGAQVLLSRIAQGVLFSNAYSEVGTKTVADIRTKIQKSSSADFHEVEGVKHYCTGSLGADWFFGVATDPAEGKQKIFFVPADVNGLVIHDDWHGMGQRTTASGTIEFHGVQVPSDYVIDIEQTMRPYSTVALLYQAVHVAVFIGIGKAAVADAASYLAEKSRPWYEAEIDCAVDDPYALRTLGEIQSDVWAAEALAQRAAEFCQVAEERQEAVARGEASVRTGAARQVSIEAALKAANLLFKICGTSSIQQKYGFDRHWRNVRALSLHNPMDHKLKKIGEFAASGALPAPDAYN